LDTAESLRERAARSRGLASESTDVRTRIDLMMYAQELEDRAVRMEAAERGNTPQTREPEAAQRKEME
jgi:hypothetical protein